MWPEIKKIIEKEKYDDPTPIQMQVLPIALSGRDVIAVAKTGSGKTIGYIIPLLVHIMQQSELQKEDGPIGVVVVPTRFISLPLFNNKNQGACTTSFFCGKIVFQAIWRKGWMYLWRSWKI